MALPQFQQTRTTLAMLGMWISCAYREGYGRARRESLLTLGSAPLSDREFLSATLRQLNETRLQAAIHADISAPNGQPPSHAEVLDQEISEGAGKMGIHKRVATSLFFESCGGQTDRTAHLPELYFAVGDPETETTLIHTSVQNLERRCYFLRAVGVDGWRFGHAPTLRKVHADRKAALDPDNVLRQMGEFVKTIFKNGAEIDLVLFPKDSTDVPDRAALTLAVLQPDESWQASGESQMRQRIAEWTRKCGQSSRQNPGGVLWIACENAAGLKTACEELMAWQAVADDANRGTLGDLEPDDQRRITRELSSSKAQIEERVWGSYDHLLLWDAGVGDLKDIVLGQLHPSEARSITSAILARLRHDSLLSREIGASYIERNWPPAFKESGAWPLAGLKAAFFQGQFTRLEKADDALRTTIVRAVTQGALGLASGKDASNFDRVWFKESVDGADITFDYDTYVLLARVAAGLKEGRASGVTKTDQGKPPVLTPDPDGTTTEPPKQGSLQMDAEEKQVLSWEGELRRDQWNLFSLKVLTRLGQTDEATIKVQVAAKPKDSSVKDQLNQGLKDLGLQGRFQTPSDE